MIGDVPGMETPPAARVSNGAREMGLPPLVKMTLVVGGVAKPISVEEAKPMVLPGLMVALAGSRYSMKAPA